MNLPLLLHPPHRLHLPLLLPHPPPHHLTPLLLHHHLLNQVKIHQAPPLLLTHLLQNLPLLHLNPDQLDNMLDNHTLIATMPPPVVVLAPAPAPALALAPAQVLAQNLTNLEVNKENALLILLKVNKTTSIVQAPTVIRTNLDA